MTRKNYFINIQLLKYSLNFLHLFTFYKLKLIVMPIRMTDDPKDQNQNDYNDDQGGGGGNGPNLPGGGGGIGALLPLLLGLFKGKGIIVLLVLAVGAYFLLGRG